MVLEITKNLDYLEERILKALKGKVKVNKLQIKDNLNKDSKIKEVITNLQKSYEFAEKVKYVIRKSIENIFYNNVLFDYNPRLQIDKLNEYVALCPVKHIGKKSQKIAKGLFLQNIPIQTVRWKKSSLVYIKNKTFLDSIIIENGKLICNTCSKKKKTYTNKVKRGEVFIYRKAYDLNLAYENIINSLKKEHGISNRMIEIAEEHSESLGFSSLISLFEKSQFSRISYFGFKKEIQSALTHVRNEYIPKRDMVYRQRTKLSIVDKHFLIKYVDKDRKFDDFLGFRVILKNNDHCYRLVREIKNSNCFFIENEYDYISNPKSNDYRSYHLSLGINPVYLADELGDVVDYDDPLIQSISKIFKVEAQIRNNIHDNKAENEANQSHGNYKTNQNNINKDQISKNPQINLCKEIMNSMIIPQHIYSNY